MKTFFATAAIAAIAIADDAVMDASEACWDFENCYEERRSEFEREVERFYENFAEDWVDFWDDFARDPQGVMAEGAQEAKKEVERGIEELQEELECLVADAEGHGNCSKRDREQAQEDCWNRESEGDVWWTWDWDTQECITNAEMEIRRELQCAIDGGEWMEYQEGWGWFDCYKAGEDPWADCMVSGVDMEYDWETEQCTTREVWCTNQGQTWVVDEWGSWCQWNLIKNLDAKKSRVFSQIVDMKPKMKQTLANYNIILDNGALSEAIAPAVQGQLQGAAMLDQIVDSWGAEVERWVENQKRFEMEAFCNLAREIAHSVELDAAGTKLEDVMPAPRECDNHNVLVKSLRQNKNLLSAVEEAAQIIQGKGVTIDFTAPDEQQLSSWFDGLKNEVERIYGAVQDVEKEFEPRFNDLEQEWEAAVDAAVGEDIENVIAGLVEDIAPVVQSIEAQTWGYNTLAFKREAAATSSKKSNAGFYAGVSFGVLSVVASAAMIAACNKKKTQECEETLL